MESTHYTLNFLIYTSDMNDNDKLYYSQFCKKDVSEENDRQYMLVSLHHEKITLICVHMCVYLNQTWYLCRNKRGKPW